MYLIIVGPTGKGRYTSYHRQSLLNQQNQENNKRKERKTYESSADFKDNSIVEHILLSTDDVESSLYDPG